MPVFAGIPLTEMDRLRGVIRMIRKNRILCALFITAALLIVTSCLKSAMTYEGKQVKEENRIAISDGGPHKSDWKTRDLTLDYTYTRKGDNLELSGVIKFTNHLVTGYITLVDFRIHIHFTDAEGIITGGQVVAISGHRQEIENISFKKEVELPEGAVSMVFSYRGSADQGGRDEGSWMGVGSDWDFWTTPTR